MKLFPNFLSLFFERERVGEGNRQKIFLKIAEKKIDKKVGYSDKKTGEKKSTKTSQKKKKSLTKTTKTF